MLASLIDDEKKLGDCQFELWKQSYMPHAPLCTASSGAAAAWTWSRVAAPALSIFKQGTSWSSPTLATLGLFWASQPTTTPSRRLAHHPPEA